MLSELIQGVPSVRLYFNYTLLFSNNIVVDCDNIVLGWHNKVADQKVLPPRAACCSWGRTFLLFV